MNTPPTCRWITCDRLATHGPVCERCRDRTLRAGRRAAAGADLATVRRGTYRYDKPRTPVADRLEDLQFLIEQGTDPEDAANRCGWNRRSALTIARRHGHDDLADLLIREGMPA